MDGVDRFPLPPQLSLTTVVVGGVGGGRVLPLDVVDGTRQLIGRLGGGRYPPTPTSTLPHYPSGVGEGGGFVGRGQVLTVGETVVWTPAVCPSTDSTRTVNLLLVGVH